MHSPDLSQDSIAKIRALFPDCVTEAADEHGKLRLAVDFDQLRQVLSDHIVEGPQERYRLDWPGKREALLTANAPIAKTLRPCREESVAFDTTQNLFIEGDNLDALKLLQESYLGKVKMIYIDPPYNTGNDFIYDDDFSESLSDFLINSNQEDASGISLVANTEANGRFHSDWLSMIMPRLKIARNLLAHDGVVFISIDSGEAANLRKVCDEVFGESNFIDNLVWQKKVSPSNDSRFFSNDHEIILCYAKEKDFGVIRRQDRTEKHNQYYKNPDNDKRGVWNSTAATCNKSSIERPNLYYPIKNPNNGEDVYPSKSAVWALSKENMQRLIEDNRIYWGQDGKSKSPRIKNFLSEAKNVVPRNILGYDDFGNTQSATAEYKSLMGDALFGYPKPSKLISGLIRFCGAEKSEDFIIVDFFAGSGTTAHAAISQNAADGGNRRFILVQLPEETDPKSEAHKAGYKTIADISKERVRRAGKKVLEGPCHEGWNRDVGFRVLKIDSSNMTDVYYRPDEVKQDELFGQVDSVKPDRSGEDLLFQVLIDWGVELTLPITREVLHGKTVYSVDGNALIACFDSGVSDALIKDIAARAPLRAVFRDTSFARDADRINAEQLFRQLSPGTDLKAI